MMDETELFSDPRKICTDARIVRTALIHRWPITDKFKARCVKKLRMALSIAETARDIEAVVRTAAMLEGQNQKDQLAAVNPQNSAPGNVNVNVQVNNVNARQVPDDPSTLIAIDRLLEQRALLGRDAAVAAGGSGGSSLPAAAPLEDTFGPNDGIVGAEKPADHH